LSETYSLWSRGNGFLNIHTTSVIKSRPDGSRGKPQSVVFTVNKTNKQKKRSYVSTYVVVVAETGGGKMGERVKKPAELQKPTVVHERRDKRFAVMSRSRWRIARNSRPRVVDPVSGRGRSILKKRTRECPSYVR